VPTQDEVGHLARSFNRFLGTLGSIMADTMGISSQLGAASEELSATSEEAASAITQIATAMGQMAQDAGAQTKSASASASSIQRLDDTLTQMSAGISDEARQIGGASQSVTLMADSISAIQDGVTQVGESAGQTSAAASRGQEAVNRVPIEVRIDTQIDLGMIAIDDELLNLRAQLGAEHGRELRGSGPSLVFGHTPHAVDREENLSARLDDLAFVA
jgi:methyl-accepting chemotaxis protein